jgi:multisubunit Na+/H+ antiporter MnhF subunit
MLVMGYPQFETQNDFGIGHDISPISEWQLEVPDSKYDALEPIDVDIDYEVRNVFFRLRNIFRRAERIPFPTTQLYDLTCFVVHRLLLTVPNVNNVEPSLITECVRYALILYMFIVHGPTYYSHAVILNTMIMHLMEYFEQLSPTSRFDSPLDIWLVVIGMVSSTGTVHHQWFVRRAKLLAASIPLNNSDDVLTRIKDILWLETPHGEDIF